MKKALILVSILALPLITFGAVQVIKNYSASDYIAVIQLESSVIRVYKVEDSVEQEIKCYVASRDYPLNRNTTEGLLSMSCVNNLEDLTSRVDDLQSKVGKLR